MSSNKTQLPPKFEEIDYKKLEKDAQEKMKSFSDLLDTLSSLEEKKKALWKHIFQNAVTDRNNAYMCFADLYKHVHNDPVNHGLHGQTIAKYLERMSKTNEQLLKLAELVAAVQEKERAAEEEEDLGPADIYDKIGKGKFQ